MPARALGRFVRAIGLVVSLTACAVGAAQAAPAGVVITNTATAAYADPNGTRYGATSNTVAIAVAAVAAIAVSPKESAVDPRSESYPIGTPIERIFTITNTGNAADAYTIASLTTGGGAVTAVAFLTAAGRVPVTVGSTVSPTLQPGESIKVAVVLTTAGVAAATPFAITLTARSTVTAASNGLVSDSGREWAIATPAAAIAGPTGPDTAIMKLVDQVRSHAAKPGETVTYTIAFRNYGGSAATNVVVTDDVPAGLRALPQTAAINGQSAAAGTSLAGQRLTIRVGTLPAGASELLTFDAVVGASLAAGTSVVNVAILAADGIAPVATTPASILVGLSNVVYDGYGGAGAPVAGAVLTLRDARTHLPVGLPLPGAAPTPATPNAANANPFTTGSDGAYGFLFALAQLGTPGRPAEYELSIVAPGYRDRTLAITLAPDATGLLYTATIRALDGQQLAFPGGFSLVASSVTLSEVFGLLGNMPLFAPHPLAVAKSVDRDVASGGDRLLYTLTVGAAAGAFGTTRVVDTLPPGVVYAPGTARVDGVPVEPVRDGRVLTWTLPSLAAQHEIVYACVVMPFVTEGSALTNVVDVDALAPSGAHARGSASADTRVIAGALGNRIVVTGRVFVDLARSGRFHEGDRGLAGVRIYLEDGESVTTDAYGRYTFPAVHPGQHVLRVDPASLPATVRPYAEYRYDSPKSLQRLLHGIYDAGLMHDVNFALEPSS